MLPNVGVGLGFIWGGGGGGGGAFSFLLPEYEIWLPMHGYQSVMNANSTQQNITQYAEGPIFLEEHATPPPPSMRHTANIALSIVSNSHPCISSLVPRLIVWGKVEPGTHCLHMRKNLRKRVSKRIRE